MSHLNDRPASGFRAELIAAPQVNAAGTTPILFDTERFDRLGEYDPLTGMFTPIRAGYYLLTFNVSVQSAIVGTNMFQCIITIVGVADIAAELMLIANGAIDRRNMSAIIYLTPNMSVYCQETHAAVGNLTIRNDARYCCFSAYRLA